MQFQTVELPYIQDSADLFARIADLPWAAYLDSCQPSAQQGRYDILTALPYITLRTVGDSTEIQTKNQIITSKTDPFELLKKHLFINNEINHDHGLLFTGGALGYFSYDLARRLEKLPTQALRDIELPEMAVGIYDWAVIIDHQTKTACLVTQNNDPHTSEIWPDLVARLKNPLSGTATILSI
jgi:para-aminobenzoate synthetase component 1